MADRHCHFFDVCDVSHEADVASFCTAVLENFGAPDLVLNNAAIMNHPAPLWETSEADFSRIIDINIFIQLGRKDNSRALTVPS